MSSTARARLGDLNTGPVLGMPEQSQNYNMQPRNPRATYGTNWGNGIWAPPIGSGMKSASETNRTNSKPAPLFRPGFGAVSGEENAEHMGETPSEKTGSGSLLRSSESEGWGSRWPPMNSASTTLGIALTSARSNHTNSSPVRQRTNQHTRSNSPYFPSQPSAIGSSAPAKSATGSVLDPTSRSFNASGFFGGFPQTLSPQSESNDTGWRNLSAIHFGSLAGTDTAAAAYSGYNSSVASRSGSVPPSRNGNDPSIQYGDVPNSAMFSTSADPYSHRQTQHSRTSTFSMNGNAMGSKLSNQAWQTTMGDLSAVTGKLDLGRDATDNTYPSHWDQSNQISSPGSINSVPAANFLNGRHNSISIDTASGLMSNGLSHYGQQRNQFIDRQSYSPTGSDIRRNNDSPMYFNNNNNNNNTPPIPDHARALSTNSSRVNLNAYSQTLLDRKLRGLAEQQQNYHPSPALSYKSTYTSPYDFNQSSAQSFSRANPQTQQYYQNASMGGYAGSVASQRMPPRGPASEMSGGGESLRSPLLEEFRQSKGTKRWELKDIYNHIVEFSGDQHGSRFIQQKLETANSDEKAQLFTEILSNALQLMTDVFGNYVIQKIFEHGNQQQKKQLADKMKGHISDFSLQMYGCRVVQKAFEHVLVDQQAILVKELENQVLKCVKDQNGNHVIQKAIQRIPAQHISFIINAFTNQVHHLATHPYGCRVIQRMLENCHEPAKTNILDELHVCAANLIVDQYGNYVTQHIIEHGRESDRNKIISIITGNLVGFATQKFASNVVEKSIQFATVEQRQGIINVIGFVDERGESTMQRLMRDQYGNYIIQKLIKQLQDSSVASPAEYENFVGILKPQLLRLKQFSYGKQIGQIERLITSGPPSTLTTAQPSSASSGAGHRPPQLDISVAPTPPLMTEDTQSPQSSSQPSTSQSAVDEPINGRNGEAPGKSSTSHVEVADNITITAASITTPKATET